MFSKRNDKREKNAQIMNKKKSMGFIDIEETRMQSILQKSLFMNGNI